jgi:hypothetical protein
MSRRTLFTSGFNLRRRDTAKSFSIQQIFRRRRRSTAYIRFAPIGWCILIVAVGRRRLLLYVGSIALRKQTSKPSVLLYWKIPCVSARICRRSCSSTILALRTLAPLLTGYLYVGNIARAGATLRPRLWLKGRAHRTVTLLEFERDADGVWGMKRILVLTPLADAFLRGGLALVLDVA